MTAERLHYPRAIVVLEPVIQTLKPGERKTIRRVNIVPESCSWTSDDLTAADRAQVEIPWRMFPLDPRLLISCRMVLYMADATDPRVDLDYSNEHYAQFVGYVDEHEVTAGTAGGMVRLGARDYSGPLIDVRWSGASLRADIPLSQAIRSVTDLVPGFSALTISVERDVTVQSYTGLSTWTPPRSANLWEVITGMAQATGQVADWDLGVLDIRIPKPVDGSRARLMALGNTIDSFSMRKTPSPLSFKQIQIRSLNPATGQMTEGLWPKETDGTRERIVIATASELGADQLQQQAKAIFETYARRHVQGSFTTHSMVDDEGVQFVGSVHEADTGSYTTGTTLPHSTERGLTAEERRFLREVEAAERDGSLVVTPSEGPRGASGASRAVRTTLRSGDAVYIDTRMGRQGLLFGQSPQQMESYLVDGGLEQQEASDIVDTWMKASESATLFAVRRATHRMDNRGGYLLTVDFENVVGA